MKVAVVSNLEPERCGNREYGLNLATQLALRFDTTLMNACPHDSYDVVVVNWHSAVVWCSIQEVRRLKEMGSKVVLIIQESSPQMNADEMFAEANVVTAHEPVAFGGRPVNFRLVPHGIPPVEDLSGWKGKGPTCGDAGFPFPAKRMDLTVKVAAAIGGSALLVAPAHGWRDPADLYAQWKQLGEVHIVSDWLEQELVVRRLSECEMLVHMDESGLLGQSGSVGLCLAARRPTIVKRHLKVKMLEQYADELYLVNSETEAVQIARQIHADPASAKVPSRLVAELSWNHVGSMYADIVEELVPAA